MAGVILSLIQMAVGGAESKDPKKSRTISSSRRGIVIFFAIKCENYSNFFLFFKEDKEKFKFSDKLASQIADYLISDDVLPFLEKVLKYFLLACNASECRWQIHSIVQSMFE